MLGGTISVHTHINTHTHTYTHTHLVVHNTNFTSIFCNHQLDTFSEETFFSDILTAEFVLQFKKRAEPLCALDLKSSNKPKVLSFDIVVLLIEESRENFTNFLIIMTFGS